MAQTGTVRLDTRRLDQMSAHLDMNRDRLLGAIAHDVEGDVKTSMGPGTGRAYKRTKSGRVHRSSVPGQPPAPDTGALKGSISTVKKKPGLYWVQDGVDYGIHLELGTIHMAARPFMRPAVFKAQRNFNKHWEGLFE
jgi:hypothetical protein